MQEVADALVTRQVPPSGRLELSSDMTSRHHAYAYPLYHTSRPTRSCSSVTTPYLSQSQSRRIPKAFAPATRRSPFVVKSDMTRPQTFRHHPTPLATMRALRPEDQQWIFPQSALDHTPSRQDGISLPHELEARKLTISWIRSLWLRVSG